MIADYTRIPPITLDSLRLYIEERRHTGSFLEAVLSNDLREACNRADTDNARALFDLVAYLHNRCPSGCWGSPEKVSQWLGRKV